MFPEYRDLITQLKTTDSHFLNVYEKHNELDQRIRNMESGIEPATHLAIEALTVSYTHLTLPTILLV